MSKKYFTDDELIKRVWDVEDIKSLMNRRVYYIANEMRREELTDLWVSGDKARKSASFGRNWGYYTGMDEISSYYVVAHEEKRRKQLTELSKANPAIKNIRENLGTGSLAHHPASTALVELAGDGKTARGMWYCISQETEPKTDGTAEAVWYLEKIAADFLKEGDDWKIWHIVIITDLYTEAGTDYQQQSVYPDDSTNPAAIEFGTPTIRMQTHDTTFNWWDNYPPMPDPYYTFSDETGYGPEGHPDYKGAVK